MEALEPHQLIRALKVAEAEARAESASPGDEEGDVDLEETLELRKLLKLAASRAALDKDIKDDERWRAALVRVRQYQTVQ